MKEPRGDVLLFTLVLVIPFLLTMAGLAVDIGGLVTVRSELHRAMDAAALAGAGKLGFDSSVFPAVRLNAAAYAAINPTRYGAVSLNSNDSNDPAGDIVLGVWVGGVFSPSLDGTRVNAVLCRTAQNAPTSFLRLIGLTTIPISAQSIAVANPPNSIPPPACLFPMGVTTCQFQEAGAFTSQGCGTAMTFGTSSGKVPGTRAGTNTAAWVNVNGTGTPSTSQVRAALAAANGGTCTQNPVAGQSVGTQNGMDQPVVDDLESYFLAHYNASDIFTIKDTGGNVVYQGKGWEIYVALIETECPRVQEITQDHKIQTFSKLVITQVINHGDCVVNNPADTNSWPLCPPPNGNAPKDPSLRAVFGYFECGGIDTVPTPVPTPRAALATRLRLVQ